MRLTTYTDFGLRALMRLAAEPDRSFTSDEIASEFEISRHHLIKVVRGLAEAGYVRTQRGAAGGFRLARPAGSITLGEVVRDLEEDQPLVECFRADGGGCVWNGEACWCASCGASSRLKAGIGSSIRKTGLPLFR